MTKTKLFVIDPHPAIPPSDLLKEWEDKWFNEEEHADVLLIQAFQAGADQELEACCTQLADKDWYDGIKNLRDQFRAAELRAARRPKPPSLKQEALRGLEQLAERLEENRVPADLAVLRRALEALPDD